VDYRELNRLVDVGLIKVVVVHIVLRVNHNIISAMHMLQLMCQLVLQLQYCSIFSCVGNQFMVICLG